ncbi:MAG: tripartite tricarboxylate transporter substrate binding protein [Burkholderiaceae bacterium]
MLRRTACTRLLGAMSLIAAPRLHAADAYPARPLTLIVPWGAGGATDATARIVAALLEKELGQPVNVVNRTGGNGVVGHQAIVSAPPDGYTIGMATVEVTMLHWLGLTKIGPADLTPIALLSVEPAAVIVPASSPHRSVNDLLAAIKAQPGKLKASGTGQGGIWHLAWAGLLRDVGIDPRSVRWVPSNGAAPAMTDLAAGGVDVAVVSLPEARPMIDAGKARALAVMAERPSPLYPSVPTLKSQTGSSWVIGGWRGLAAPRGLPPPIAERLGAAMHAIYDGQPFQDFMAQRGFGMVWRDGPGFGEFMAAGDREMGVLMKAAGIRA